MSADRINPTDAEDRLAAALVECLEAIDKGQPLDPQELRARYPDLAPELARFLDDQGQVDGFAAPLRAAALGRPLPPMVAAQRSQSDSCPAQLGDFRIVGELGRGGMGVVYRAEQISLRRPVALKVLPQAATLDGKHLQRFKNEAQAAASLQHPHIVPVYAIDCDKGVHFYAMQLIDGLPLTAVIARQRAGQVAVTALSGTDDRSLAATPDGSLSAQEARSGEGTTSEDAPSEDRTSAYTAAPAPPRRPSAPPGSGTEAVSSAVPSGTEREYFRWVAQVGVQAAKALDHAHQMGVVHRDVKPANLLLDSKGHLWVTDFGLAQVRQQEGGLTQTGDIIGTIRYMSPEQAQAQRDVLDQRTDVYSLGATLYELLTLRAAFTSTDRQELLRQVVSEEPPRPRQLRRSIPVDLETIVLKAIEKRSHDRYATAQELAEDLQRFLDDLPIRARRPTVPQRVAKWVRRHRPIAVAAASVFLIAVVVLAISTALITTAYQEESIQRGEAEQQAQLAREAQEEEARQRKQAQDSRDAAEEALYLSRMQLARHAWQAGNLKRLQTLLASCRPRAGRQDFRHWEWHYLQAWCEQGLALGNWDDNELMRRNETTTAWSCDGQRIAMSHLTLPPPGAGLYSPRPSALEVWDAATQRQVWKLPGPVACPNLLVWSPNGKWLVSGSGYGRSRQVDIREAVAGRVVRTLMCPEPAEGLDWSPDGARLATTCRSVYVWEAATGKRLFTVQAGFTNWRTASFSLDGRRLVTAGSGVAQVCDAFGGRQVCVLPVAKEFSPEGSPMLWSPDSARLICAGGRSREVPVWDARTGRELFRLPVLSKMLQGGQAWGAAWSPDGAYLATLAPEDHLVHIWDAHTGQKAFALQSTGPLFGAPAWSPDGRRLAANAGTLNQTVVWEVATREHLFTVRSQNCGLGGWSPDGARLLTCGFDRIHTWDGTDGQDARPLVGHTKNTSAAAWSPGGQHLASASGDGTVKIWDARSGEDVLTLRGAERGVTDVAWSPDGHLLATVEGYNEPVPRPNLPAAFTQTTGPYAVRLWDATTGKELRVLMRCRSGHIFHCAFSPDGKKLVVHDQEGDDPKITTWDPLTGKQLLTWKCGSTETESKCFFSSDGGTLATVRLGPKGREIVCWDADSGRVLHALPCPNQQSGGATAFFPKGSLLACALFGQIVLLDITTGKEMLRLKDTGVCFQLAFTPDGRRLASFAAPSGIKVHDTRTGEEVLELPLPPSGSEAVKGLSFSPDGIYLAAVGFDNKVWLWEGIPRAARRSSDPQHPGYRQHLRNHYWALASDLARKHHLAIVQGGLAGWEGAQAETSYGQALKIQQELVRLSPADPARRHELALLYRELGDLSRDGDRPKAAEECYHSSLDLLQRLARDFPAGSSYRSDLGRTWKGRVSLFERTGRLEDRLAALEKVVTFLPDSYEDCNDLAWLLVTHPDPRRRDPKRAVLLARRALDLAPWKRAIPGKVRGGVLVTALIAGYRDALGLACYRAGDWKEAVDTLEPMLGDPWFARVLPLTSRFVLAMAYARLGAKEKAHALYQQTVQLMRKLPNNAAAGEVGALQAEASDLLGLKKPVSPKNR